MTHFENMHVLRVHSCELVSLEYEASIHLKVLYQCNPENVRSEEVFIKYSYLFWKIAANVHTTLKEITQSTRQSPYCCSLVALGGLVISVLATGPKVRRLKPCRGR
jgi:hypothetical protein